MACETTTLPPPTYNNVILENMLSWNLPDDILEAIESLLYRPLKPPEHPYRYVCNCSFLIRRNLKYLDSLDLLQFANHSLISEHIIDLQILLDQSILVSSNFIGKSCFCISSI